MVGSLEQEELRAVPNAVLVDRLLWREEHLRKYTAHLREDAVHQNACGLQGM